MENSFEARKRRLYGPERNIRVEQIRNNLSKSCVLKDGEYNFTPKGLSRSVFDTTYDTDFPWKKVENKEEKDKGQSLDPNFLPDQKEQLSHHFEIGNDSGKDVPKETYRDSTTKADFLQKPPSKPEMVLDKRIINWPDMAPRYMTSRKMETSEYKTSYIPEFLRTNSVPPAHPRLNTSIMKLPLASHFVHPQRNTSIAFGSDKPSVFSEFQRVYGIGDEPTSKMEIPSNDKDSVRKDMKTLEKESHVFRDGDYDNIVGKMKSTVNDDYGPRTLPPGEAAIRKAKLKEIKENPEQDEIEDSNQLAEYARQVTVPNVFRDADEGRNYQTTAHFQFGSDPDTSHSIYNKDYISRSVTTRGPPTKMITADAGSLFQNDPSYLKEPTTSNKTDFSYTPAVPWKNSKGQTLMEMNLEKRDTDNVVMSYDPERHTFDRQISLAHADYTGPPKGYKPMEPVKKPRVVFDYLTPNDALPYPGLTNRTSEAKTNFGGSIMSGSQAVVRRRQQENVCKQRLNDGKNTHFIVGYQPFDFSTESQLQFCGDQKNDDHIQAAGKTEKKKEGKPFLHFFVSQNTQDLKANDPYLVDTMESVRARANHCRLPAEHAMRSSVMKSDFTPLEKRTVSNIEVRTMMDCDKKLEKPISSSHLFHTDTSGRNNFMTTAMTDFIKPEAMTEARRRAGQKFLAAR